MTPDEKIEKMQRRLNRIDKALIPMMIEVTLFNIYIICLAIKTFMH